MFGSVSCVTCLERNWFWRRRGPSAAVVSELGWRVKAGAALMQDAEARHLVTDGRRRAPRKVLFRTDGLDEKLVGD